MEPTEDNLFAVFESRKSANVELLLRFHAPQKCSDGECLSMRERVPEFGKFADDMSAVKQLRSLPAHVRDNLLQRLYAVAEDAHFLMQDCWLHSQLAVENFRDTIRDASGVLSVLVQAIADLVAMQAKYNAFLRAVVYQNTSNKETMSLERRLSTLSDDLLEVMYDLFDLRSRAAERIHPKMRSRGEQKLAKQVPENDHTKHLPFRPEEDSTTIKHWVIAEAAAALHGADHKVDRPDIVISHFLEYGLGIYCADDNVRQTLKRQRITGKPTRDLQHHLPSRTKRRPERRVVAL
jgi:hypothetical protein